MTQFYGLGAAGPDHAGAFAPGYGAWLNEQRAAAEAALTPQEKRTLAFDRAILRITRERHRSGFITTTPRWFRHPADRREH